MVLRVGTASWMNSTSLRHADRVARETAVDRQSKRDPLAVIEPVDPQHDLAAPDAPPPAAEPFLNRRRDRQPG